jgi:glycosyltransferase involved in cell wall biosynthesis
VNSGLPAGAPSVIEGKCEGISVGLIVHNDAQTVSLAMESIVATCLRYSIGEVILVDNGSRDGSAETASRILARGPFPFRLIRSPRNSIGLARQMVINAARYEKVAFADADCEVPEDWLSRLDGAHSLLAINTGHVAAVGGDNIAHQGDGWISRALGIMAGTFSGTFGSAQMRKASEPERIAHLSTTNIIYDKRAVLRVGNFCENLARVGEDLEMSLRLCQAGERLFFVPGATVIHHQPASLPGWLAKVRKYGRAQPLVYLEMHGQFSYRLAPLGAALLFLVCWEWSSRLAGALFIVYFTAITVEVFCCGTQSGLMDKIRASFLIFLTHLAYGIGEVEGLLEWGARAGYRLIFPQGAPKSAAPR